jgi:hypothetical protein
MPKRCDLRIEQKLEALHVLRVVCELCIEHSLDSLDSSVGHGPPVSIGSAVTAAAPPPLRARRRRFSACLQGI